LIWVELIWVELIRVELIWAELIRPARYRSAARRVRVAGYNRRRFVVVGYRCGVSVSRGNALYRGGSERRTRYRVGQSVRRVVPERQHVASSTLSRVRLAALAGVALLSSRRAQVWPAELSFRKESAET
jgi:hypothetical protein